MPVQWLMGLAIMLMPLASESGTEAPVLAHIVYLSGSTVYVDAGRDQGLLVGQKISVIRGGEEIAVLTVGSVSSKRASCSLPSGSPALAVGDTVRFSPVPILAPPEPKLSESRVRARRGNWFKRNGLRGAVDLRYLSLFDRTGGGERYSQPALNFRLRGSNVGGSAYSLFVDVRTRRTYRTRTDGDQVTTNRDRVYRMSASHQTIDSPFRISAGRQTSPNLASVSTFDGVLGEYGRDRWTTGVFLGTQPAADDYGFSTDIVEFGGFGTLTTKPRAATRVTATTGLISSRAKGVSNRDYLFLRGQLFASRVSAYVFEEIDFNGGWKRDAGESAASFTSTALSLQYRVRDDLEFRGSFDNRRSVRLARDRETPESEFDDTYRLGWSLDTDWKPWSKLRVGLGFRTYSGAFESSSDAVTGRIRLSRLTPWFLDVNARTTRYSGPKLDGWLHSLSAGGMVLRRHRLEGHLGRREEHRTEFEGITTVTGWYGVDADVNLARGWFITLSLEITRGDVEKNNQFYSGVSYRF